MWPSVNHGLHMFSLFLATCMSSWAFFAPTFLVGSDPFLVESIRFVPNILEEQEPSDLLAYKMSQKEKKYKDCNVKLIDSKMSLAALLPYGVKREVTYQKFQILQKIKQKPPKEGEEPAGGAATPVAGGSGAGSGTVSPSPQKQGPQEPSVEDLLFGLMKYTLQFSFDALIPDKFPAQGSKPIFMIFGIFWFCCFFSWPHVFPAT